MSTPSSIEPGIGGASALRLRPPHVVMDLERLGSLHQSRLSFMRCLVRKIMREGWRIEARRFELDEQGYGTVIYRIQTSGDLFSFVLFSQYLDPDKRNDRVIASEWDLTMALCEGEVDDDYVEFLRRNVPLQEAGRLDARVMVLSRANRSVRNFDSVVDALSAGRQPEVEQIARVGYLYRTTAVYGSGKLGMADWEKVSSKHPDFARPFAAEMFNCFMLRNFSLQQAEHIARRRAPDTAVPLQPQLKRYFGIGNSTGLGMAPYLINHPQLIGRWIEMRELALARVRGLGQVTAERLARLHGLVERGIRHIEQTVTEDAWQTENNRVVLEDFAALQDWLASQPLESWAQLLGWAERQLSLQAQELLNCILLELYPELVDSLEDSFALVESLELQPQMPAGELRRLIEQHYAWALAIDFDADGATETFWYRSEEKQEPRLGNCNLESGRDKQMPLGIGYLAQQCHRQLCAYLAEHPEQCTASFLLRHPEQRGIVRRMQSMARTHYGEIQANLLDREVLPMHLLRCKLAFFGVSKFDPRSKLWVRNTMFQGAPLLEDIGQPFEDDWFLPLAPTPETR
ncbi:hypothetical protein I0D00_15005 [Pseudomonas lalucatii]|uniref:Uncharacterized protein n=1 Tax=Pseudomonas lalucatii TaxID=1424203 RepID=A0ABS5Q542_9PSED|nr:hypothetical protein [Pseudomonas lalucatii]MBS7663239.1 hypothetical protein [Pseudomonas lalucatii]MBS7689936.1 hypothetical protein [Pseudomonas lalucatii]MBS7724911.1 hypothetical protein [Pseudomonas lalucatii]QVM87115.1 hypothetical protein I0D68_17035 [Pseudomonas lalucatii]